MVRRGSGKRKKIERVKKKVMVRPHCAPSEHLKASSATRRTGSPTSSQPLLHVMPLKSIGPSNISGFPTVTPCDPQQGFVSRPGGAFKFRSVQQITQSKQTNALNVAPKNPYQVCLCCHQWFIFNF